MKFVLLLLLILIVALVYRWPALKVGGWQNVKNAFIMLYKDGKIMLVKHKAIKEAPEQWHLPGGLIDSRDKTPLDAALREFHEEAEYELTNYNVLAVFDYDYAKKSANLINQQQWLNSKGDGDTRIFVLSTTDEIEDSPLDNNEMNERKWFYWFQIFINLNPYDIKMRRVAWDSFHAIMKTEIFEHLGEHHNLEKWVPSVVKPLCPHGSNCYRKNPTHFEEFRHE